MDLKDFIAETLVEIQQGVQSAIFRCRELETNGAINPLWGAPHNVSDANLREVAFDIAVTVSDKSLDKVGGAIRVMGIGVGADHAGSAETSHVSRIKFSIPIVPPTTTVAGVQARRA